MAYLVDDIPLPPGKFPAMGQKPTLELPQGHRLAARDTPSDVAIDPTPETDVQRASDDEASSQVNTKSSY